MVRAAGVAHFVGTQRLRARGVSRHALQAALAAVGDQLVVAAIAAAQAQ